MTNTTSRLRYRVQLAFGRSYYTDSMETAQTVAFRLACKSHQPVTVIDRGCTDKDMCDRWDVYPE